MLRVYSVVFDLSRRAAISGRVDRLLKEHLMLWFGVKQRTLQSWLRAGLVPGTIRTRGGHYRIRAPHGMTAEIYNHALSVFSGGGALLHKTSQAKFPPSWWSWQETVSQNVRIYNTAMRQVRRVCRGQGRGGIPFFSLEQLRPVVKPSPRRAA
jgi:hypothetical protein